MIRSGDLLGIEVKAGSAVSKDSFAHLDWFRTHIHAKKKFIGIVFYTGRDVLSFGEKMWAVPLSALWA